MMVESNNRDIKFDFKMSEKEHIKLKEVARLLNMTMADVIREGLSMKYSELLKQETERNSNAQKD